MEEVKKKNMLMNTHISRGNYSKEIKSTEISAGVSINARGPINVEIEAGKKPAWLSMIEGRGNVNITEVKGKSKGWDKKVRQLTPEAQVLIGTAVTAVTAGAGSAAGGFIGSSIGGSVGAGVGSGIATGISGFAYNLAIGTINNGGNIGKGLKESRSKQVLRSLGKDMLAAGVTTGVMERDRLW